MRRRRALLTLGGALLGCRRERARGESAPPTIVADDAGRPEAAAPAYTEEQGLDAWLDAGGVHGARFARKVVYSWTTDEQAAVIARDLRLLVLRASPSKGYASFDHEVDEHPDPVAALLRRPGLDRRRFAWTMPFATTLGRDGHGYGRQLIRIELRDEAICARMRRDLTTHDLELQDLDGRPVPATTVLAAPHRLATVLYEDQQVDPFREIVVCNESMVARFEIGTPRLVEHRAAERTEVQALARRAALLGVGGADFGDRVAATWSAEAAPTSLHARFEAALFDTTDTWWPDRLDLRAIDAALAPCGGPVVAHTPAVPFVLGAPTPPRAKPPKVIW